MNGERKLYPLKKSEETILNNSLFLLFRRAGTTISRGENIGEDNIGRNKSENEFFFETSPDE